MLAKSQIDLDQVEPDKVDQEILRLGIIAELDAINLYEQLAAKAQDEKIKKVMLDVAKEEKEHVGEFQAMLLQRDEEQVKEMVEGKKEVEEIVGE